MISAGTVLHCIDAVMLYVCRTMTRAVTCTAQILMQWEEWILSTGLFWHHKDVQACAQVLPTLPVLGSHARSESFEKTVAEAEWLRPFPKFAMGLHSYFMILVIVLLDLERTYLLQEKERICCCIASSSLTPPLLTVFSLLGYHRFVRGLRRFLDIYSRCCTHIDFSATNLW